MQWNRKNATLVLTRYMLRCARAVHTIYRGGGGSDESAARSLTAKLLAVAIIAVAACGAFAQPDITNDFVDDNFRAAVYARIGKSAPEPIHDTDVAGITTLDVRSKDIASLAGIEHFVGLEKLDCDYNKLTSLDVSGLTNLEVLACFGNQLTYLDLSSNSNLISASDGDQEVSLTLTRIAPSTEYTLAIPLNNPEFFDDDGTYSTHCTSITYDEANGILISNDTSVKSIGFSVQTGSNITDCAGTYAIKQGTLSAESNYSITFVGADFTITPKTITITITPSYQSKVAGTVDAPEITYTYTPDDPGLTFTGKLGREEGEEIGEYKITLGTLSAGKNYVITIDDPDNAFFYITPLIKAPGAAVTVPVVKENGCFAVSVYEVKIKDASAGNNQIVEYAISKDPSADPSSLDWRPDSSLARVAAGGGCGVAGAVDFVKVFRIYVVRPDPGMESGYTRGWFTAGPSPASRSGNGRISIFRRGRAVAHGDLTVFDAWGNVIKKITIRDDALNPDLMREVGFWDLTNKNGRIVGSGAYMIRGTARYLGGGGSEKVKLIIGVGE